MKQFEDVTKPSKEERKVALESYDALAATLDQIRSENPEIEIEETEEKIKVPLKALKLLAKILKAISQGKPVSLVPIATEMTTQAAAELIGCSRPHFVKLLEEGKIPYTKVGKHRRVRYDDVMNFRSQMKENRESLIIEMMKDDEELGLYDS